MNIGLVCHDVPNLTGMGTQYYLMAKHLAQTGNQVTLVKPVHHSDRTLPAEPFPNVRLIQLPVRRNWRSVVESIKARIPVVNNWSPYDIFMVKAAHTIADALPAIAKQYDLDVIEAPESRTELACYHSIRQQPTVVSMRCPPYLGHFFPELPELSPYNDYIFELQKRDLAEASGLLSVSAAVQDKARQIFGEVVNSAEVIRNAVARVDDDDIGEPAEHPTVAFLGRCTYAKGIDVLRDAMSIVDAEQPGVTYRLLGPCPDDERHALQKVTQRCSARVEICGRVPHSELSHHLRSCWLLVHPTRWDSLPNAILEAAAMAVPTVASNAGGATEIIRDGETGVIADAGSATALADALLAMLTSRQRCLQMGQAARAYVAEAFAPERIINQRLDYYRALLG